MIPTAFWIFIGFFMLFILLFIGCIAYLVYRQHFLPKALILTSKYGFTMNTMTVKKQEEKYVHKWNKGMYVLNPKFHKPFGKTFFGFWIEGNPKQQPIDLIERTITQLVEKTIGKKKKQVKEKVNETSMSIEEKRYLIQSDPDAFELKDFMEKKILSEYHNIDGKKDLITMILLIVIVVGVIGCCVMNYIDIGLIEQLSIDMVNSFKTLVN